MKKNILFCLSIIFGLLLIGCPVEEEKSEEKGRELNSWETNSIPSDFSLNHDFWDNASVYFVLTDRFYNGNTANDESYGRVKGDPTATADSGKFYGGDIKGLKDKLDYLEDLGVNAIWITAPYEQIHGFCTGGSNEFVHYPYHGYYAMDYTNIDANVGTVAEFQSFVDAAHAKGIRVIMDVVMNHPGYNTFEDATHLYPGIIIDAHHLELYPNAIQDNLPDYRTEYTEGTAVTYKNHHNFIDYKNCGEHGWDDWWGGNWIRAGLCKHYHVYDPLSGGDKDLLATSGGALPDFITESSNTPPLPQFLKKKHTEEMAEFYPTEGYNVLPLNEYSNYRVRDYLISWLSGWVRKFGIDGFRCDTAKHVEKQAWYQLKVACVQALRDWKAANSDKVIPNSGDFWMTGEHWSHDVVKDAYFTEGGFDSMINFKLRNNVYRALSDLSKIETVYNNYASKINSDSAFNALSYISSHDTGAQDQKGVFYSGYASNVTNQKLAGSLLAFCPGAIQIYYGDECGRKDSAASFSGDKDQKNRSQMPWKSTEAGYNSDLSYQFNEEIYDHWSKVLNFRKAHVAIGAGSHSKIADAPYTFSRIKGDDKVVIVLGATAGESIEVDVSAIGATSVKDAYTGATTTVTNGKATFTVGDAGAVLIEKSNN